MMPYSRLKRIIRICPMGLPLALKMRDVTPAMPQGSGSSACQKYRRRQESRRPKSTTEAVRFWKRYAVFSQETSEKKKIGTRMHIFKDLMMCRRMPFRHGSTRWQNTKYHNSYKSGAYPAKDTSARNSALFIRRRTRTEKSSRESTPGSPDGP